MRDNLVVGGREARAAVGRKFRTETVPLFLDGHPGSGQRRQPGQRVGLWAACIGGRDFAKGDPPPDVEMGQSRCRDSPAE